MPQVPLTQGQPTSHRPPHDPQLIALNLSEVRCLTITPVCRSTHPPTHGAAPVVFIAGQYVGVDDPAGHSGHGSPFSRPSSLESRPASGLSVGKSAVACVWGWARCGKSEAQQSATLRDPLPDPLENARTSAVDATPMMTAKNRATKCKRMVPFFLSVGVCCFVCEGEWA